MVDRKRSRCRGCISLRMGRKGVGQSGMATGDGAHNVEEPLRLLGRCVDGVREVGQADVSSDEIARRGGTAGRGLPPYTDRRSTCTACNYIRN